MKVYRPRCGPPKAAREGLKDPSKLVKQRPNRPIAPQPCVLLELKRRKTLLVTGQDENAQKPHAKRGTGSMKDGPCSHRALISARSALVEAAASKEVTPPTAAAWALESTWPTGAAQVRPAMGLIRELILKLDERARKLHSDFL